MANTTKLSRVRQSKMWAKKRCNTKRAHYQLSTHFATPLHTICLPWRGGLHTIYIPHFLDFRQNEVVGLHHRFYAPRMGIIYSKMQSIQTVPFILIHQHNTLFVTFSEVVARVEVELRQVSRPHAALEQKTSAIRSNFLAINTQGMTGTVRVKLIINKRTYIRTIHI